MLGGVLFAYYHLLHLFLFIIIFFYLLYFLYSLKLDLYLTYLTGRGDWDAKVISTYHREKKKKGAPSTTR